LIRIEKQTFFLSDLFRYHGKGTSRSDEIGDEKRIFAKFKVSLF
jgi:hypothetical protein